LRNLWGNPGYCIQIKDRAILVGFTPNGGCVYSTSMPSGDYCDGEHVWDDHAQIKRLKLEKLVGFRFGRSGNLMQRFESTFDLQSGIFKNGWGNHDDGTCQQT